MKASPIKVEDMAAHVEALIARFHLNSGSHSRGGRAWHKTKRVTFKPVKSVVTYLVALHEIGHVVYPKAHNGTRLEKEFYAWKWALVASIVKRLTPQAARAIYSSLNSYVLWAKNRQYRKVPPRIPEESHPIWKLLAQLDRVIKQEKHCKKG